MFALSFHEFAHAWMASKCGDSTAARMGRLTLNPMAHLDVMGSMMILFVGFGWAKPVPVDGRNLRNPRTDMMKVAAAGPLSNLLLAMIAGMLFRLLSGAGLLSEAIYLLIIYFTQINIALAVFNLIPVAPLDLRGFMDIDDTIPAGFQKITGTVTISSPASEDDIIRLQKIVDQHCPVLDDLRRPLDVSLNIEVEPEAAAGN